MLCLELLGFMIIKRELLRLIGLKYVFCLFVLLEFLGNILKLKRKFSINSKEVVFCI